MRVLAILTVLLLLSLLIASTVHGESAQVIEPVATSIKVALVATSTDPAPITSNEGIEKLIKKEFAKTPKMIAIVRCESRFRQYNKWGTPLTSHTNDVGVMQINKVHWVRAKKLGLDIHNSVYDNIAMGKIILKEQGMGAWYAPTTC